MVDFKKKLEEELARVNGSSSSSSERHENNFKEQLYSLRKNKPQYISKNNPFLGRILSLGKRWFAKEVNEIEFTINTSKGKHNFHPSVYRDGNQDSLSDMTWEVMKFNSKYRKEHNTNDNPIDIKEKGVGVGFAGTSISQFYEIIGIPSDSNGDLVKNSDGTYKIVNYLISSSIYKALVNLLADKTYRVNGNSLPDGFLSQRDTYAVQIKYDGSHMNVSARTDIVYPPMEYNYLKRNNEDTDFVYFDDPEQYNQKIVDYDKDYHNYLEYQLSKSIVDKASKLNVHMTVAEKYLNENKSDNISSTSQVPVSSAPVEPSEEHKTITVEEDSSATQLWPKEEQGFPKSESQRMPEPQTQGQHDSDDTAFPFDDDDSEQDSGIDSVLDAFN